MTEKVNQEEEQKLIGIKTYYLKMMEKQVTDPIIDDIKNNVVAKLQTLVIPMGQDIELIKNTKLEIEDILYDPIFDDIYDDQVTQLFKNYMHYTRMLHYKSNLVINIIAEAMIDIFEKANDMGTRTRAIYLKEGELLMGEEERDRFKAKMSRFVVRYKKDIETGNLKTARLITKRLYDLADTSERYELINFLFYEFTGEYVLDKIKKEMIKKEEVVQNIQDNQ